MIIASQLLLAKRSAGEEASTGVLHCRLKDMSERSGQIWAFHSSLLPNFRIRSIAFAIEWESQLTTSSTTTPTMFFWRVRESLGTVSRLFHKTQEVTSITAGTVRLVVALRKSKAQSSRSYRMPRKLEHILSKAFQLVRCSSKTSTGDESLKASKEYGDLEIRIVASADRIKLLGSW